MFACCAWARRCSSPSPIGGPGWRRRKLAGIFDPFVRIGSPRMGKGYGLGLAIARKAVILQGGTIQACNRAQGGLRVTMTLPLHDPS
nr:ATP-binding protein [Aeromonas caviae]